MTWRTGWTVLRSSHSTGGDFLPRHLWLCWTQSGLSFRVWGPGPLSNIQHTGQDGPSPTSTDPLGPSVSEPWLRSPEADRSVPAKHGADHFE